MCGDRIFLPCYVERSHREPTKFLFMPKMGLLGSQASTEKTNIIYEL